MTTEMVLLSSVALWKMGVEYFSIIAVGAEEEEEFILCVVWRFITIIIIIINVKKIKHFQKIVL